MRLRLFQALLVVTFAVTLAAAEQGTTVRRLKGVEKPTQEEDDGLTAESEERNGFVDAVSKMKASGQIGEKASAVTSKLGGNKWQQALEKVKAQNALKQAKSVGAKATNGNKWQQALAKLKANTNNFKNLDDIKVPVGIKPNKWQSAVEKIKSGKLNKLDTSNNKWQSAFKQLKASGHLKNVGESQVAKVTEGVAQEIVKNPQKSGYFKKFLEITFGAVLTGLIVLGFNSMIS